MKKKNFVGAGVVTVVLVILLALGLSSCSDKKEAIVEYSKDYQESCFDVGGLMGPNGCVLTTCTECPICEITEDTEAEAKVIPVVEGNCVERAKLLGAPVGSAVCTAVTLDKPAIRVQTGSKVAFGTITFDAETRVWILENFTVPSFANYSYDYTGRESYVLDAPFAVGAEKNPVNGKNFDICWNIEGDCALPEGVNLFPTKQYLTLTLAVCWDYLFDI